MSPILEEAGKKGIDGHNPDSVRVKELEKKVMAQYKVDSLSQLPVNFDAILMQTDEEYHNTVYDANFGKLQQTINQQNSVGKWASLVNPFMAIRNLSLGFAGTDYKHYVNFQTATEQYRRPMMKLLNNYMAQHSKTGDWESKAPESVWKEVPDFKYANPSVGWVIQNNVIEIAALVVWVLGLIISISFFTKRISIL